ncbi:MULTISPECIES: M23 family metallopeptidase [unclassified Streptomyces]|uniref:M23 family metallopeptidase n=1 Tax=unclassified Streptomyces TaxID=2593676 RepID=UPI0035E0DCDB
MPRSAFIGSLPRSLPRSLPVLAAAAAMVAGLMAAAPAAAAPDQKSATARAVAAELPAGTWWGVQGGVTTSHYNEFFPGYRFGCDGDQRHKGVDVGAPTGNRVYAWGRGRVVGRGYDPGGYNRWIQVYFPSVDMSLTLGHLLDGSEMRVGTTFTRGARWAKVGTEADGLNHSHVHFRAARGNHGASPVGPCEDMNPFILWDALGLPS